MVVVLKQFSFARHLKDLGHVKVALQDAIEHACQDLDLREKVVDQLPSQLGRAELYRSRHKLDAVTMNIERREFVTFNTQGATNSSQCTCLATGVP